MATAGADNLFGDWDVITVPYCDGSVFSGDNEVTDFDGTAMEERALARRWRVNFTPTIQFFPPTPEGTQGKTGVDVEVARMPGYFKPFHFISMFEFVQGRVYEQKNFQRYLQEKFAELKAKGIDPNVW